MLNKLPKNEQGYCILSNHLLKVTTVQDIYCLSNGIYQELGASDYSIKGIDKTRCFSKRFYDSIRMLDNIVYNEQFTLPAHQALRYRIKEGVECNVKGLTEIIDRNMRPLVEYLNNEKGVTTFYCCDGHFSKDIYIMVKGYINPASLVNIPNEIYMEYSEYHETQRTTFRLFYSGNKPSDYLEALRQFYKMFEDSELTTMSDYDVKELHTKYTNINFDLKKN